MTLLELAERCEKAEGPDRKLDDDIERATRTKNWAARIWQADNPSDVAPRFTASLDAALTLVPDGLLWNTGCTRNNRFGACVSDFLVDTDYPDVTGITPALALCAAALRARSAQVGRHPSGPGREAGPVRKHEHAVGSEADDAPNPSPQNNQPRKAVSRG